jgi:hypothetical protein
MGSKIGCEKVRTLYGTSMSKGKELDMLDKIIRGINYKRSKKFSVLSNNG